MASNIPLQDNLIADKTFHFAVKILHLPQLLQDKRQFILANQLQKSGTSIGANTREAQNAESISDFIHKFKITAKKADETEYWLLASCELFDKDLVTPLLIELKIIQKILTKLLLRVKTN